MPDLQKMTKNCESACPQVMNMGRTKRTAGTTLIEILVVIVVFLVGILAVVQIFPKGFDLLLQTRNNSISQALAREYVELLVSKSDQLPEQIVAAHYVNGNLVVDSGKDPNDLGPVGAGLDQTGLSSDGGGNSIGPWQFSTASNVFRRVIGEGGQVPAPRAVGTGTAYFGGLRVLLFGPISYQPATANTPSNLAVYGNDFEQIIGPPVNVDQRADYQYFVVNPNDNTITLLLPSGLYPRNYRISFSAYVSNGTGGVFKRDYTELPLVPVAAGVPNAAGQYPLATVPLIGATNLVSDPVVSVDLNTLRVQRSFTMIAKTANFDVGEPYEYKLLNENLGVLLFNPIGHETYISREGHDREPLQARVNYDVYDWRILHDDFRIDAGVLPGVNDSANPQLLTSEHKLPIASLKVGSATGPDGLPNGPIVPLETPPTDGSTDTSTANSPTTDNFVLVDLDTGGVYKEQDTSNAVPQQLIRLDKSTGTVTITDQDGNPANGITGELLLPDGNTQKVQMDNRAVRALYMAREEFSVQVLKAASQYTVSPTSTGLSTGQFYIGGTVAGIGVPWRIYFPQSDDGRKVTVGQVSYDSSADSFIHSLVGQDFLIQARPGDPLTLPSIDLTQVDPNATAIDLTNGIGARGIKGASVAVRVLWNPNGFTLTSDSPTNMTRLEQWGRGWRKFTNETYMQRGTNIK